MIKPITQILFLVAAVVVMTNATMAADSYCDGHRDGHKSYYNTEGGGYPGYPGCPGNPGGFGTPYERGFKDGMMQGVKENQRY
jgi:hypothetical protein